MKELPKVFANKIDKEINNNKKYSINNEERNIDVNKKINDILKSSKYIYKVNVEIRLKDKTIVKKIIGKKNNNLLTIDNDLININDIIDINIV